MDINTIRENYAEGTLTGDDLKAIGMYKKFIPGGVYKMEIFVEEDLYFITLVSKVIEPLEDATLYGVVVNEDVLNKINLSMMETGELPGTIDREGMYYIGEAIYNAADRTWSECGIEIDMIYTERINCDTYIKLYELVKEKYENHERITVEQLLKQVNEVEGCMPDVDLEFFNDWLVDEYPYTSSTTDPKRDSIDNRLNKVLDSRIPPYFFD